MALEPSGAAGGSSSSTASPASSSSSSSSRPRSSEETPLGARAPHEVGGPPVEYRVVIPSRGRWRPANQVSNERDFKRDSRPFIVVKTLAFLKRHRIPPRRVTLYLADQSEKEKYEHALLEDPYWAGSEVRFEVGVPGVMEQRNHIVRTSPEGEYIVSFDDDVSDIRWKHRAGSLELVSLPDGGLEPLIFFGYSLMKKADAFIWGLNATVSLNVRNLWSDGVSTRNGEINGFCYGFINRHIPALQPRVADATEDAERSLRYFKVDQRVLRYRMYAGVTKVFKFAFGLQSLFEGASLSQQNDARKVAEREAAKKLWEMFPTQIGQPRERKTVSTLEISFKALGGMVLPVTTKDHLLEANKLDDQIKNQKKTGKTSAEGSGEEEADEQQRPSGRKFKRQKCSMELGDAGKQQASLSAWLPPTPQAPSRGARTFITPDVDESGGESNQSEDEQEGADENKQFESLAASMTSGGEEDIQRALKESLKDVVLLFNGTAADPLETALKQSLELDAEENKRKREEEENFEKVLRLSSMDAGEADDKEKRHLEEALRISSMESLPESRSGGAEDDEKKQNEKVLRISSVESLPESCSGGEEKDEKKKHPEKVLRISSMESLPESCGGGEEEDHFAQAVRWTAEQRERNRLPNFDAKLGNLLEMGFESELAAKVLSKTEGDLDAAISELLSCSA